VRANLIAVRVGGGRIGSGGRARTGAGDSNSGINL